MTPERYQRLKAVLNRRQPDLTLLTDNVHKGRNLSAVVRNADAVGICDMHCVIDDKDYRAFRGTAMGSHSWVDVHRHTDIATAISTLKEQGMQVLAAHLDEDSVDYRQPDYCRPTAILLGAEKRGVSAIGAGLADAHITVPMMGMVKSFNVSVAAGIILAEAQYQRMQAGLYEACRLSNTHYQRLLFEWAHPGLRDFCRERGLAYPPLGDDGELLDAPAWNASVKAGTAEKAG